MNFLVARSRYRNDCVEALVVVVIVNFFSKTTPTFFYIVGVAFKCH